MLESKISLSIFTHSASISIFNADFQKAKAEIGFTPSSI